MNPDATVVSVERVMFETAPMAAVLVTLSDGTVFWGMAASAELAEAELMNRIDAARAFEREKLVRFGPAAEEAMAARFGPLGARGLGFGRDHG